MNPSVDERNPPAEIDDAETQQTSKNTGNDPVDDVNSAAYWKQLALKRDLEHSVKDLLPKIPKMVTNKHCSPSICTNLEVRKAFQNFRKEQRRWSGLGRKQEDKPTHQI